MSTSPQRGFPDARTLNRVARGSARGARAMGGITSSIHRLAVEQLEPARGSDHRLGLVLRCVKLRT